MSQDSDELQAGISEESVHEIRSAMQKYHFNVANEHEEYLEAQIELTRLEDAMWFMDNLVLIRI